MRAVFSFCGNFFNISHFKRNAGFLTEEMFLNSCVLSINLAKKQFKEIALYTDEFGKKIFESLDLPIDIVDDSLSNLIQPHHNGFWAISKLITYSLQEAPFAHLDLDLYLWNDLPAAFYKHDIFCYYREPFMEDVKTLYTKNLQDYYLYGKQGILKDLDAFFAKEKTTSHAFNTCIIGSVHHVDFLKKYSQDVLMYLDKYNDTSPNSVYREYDHVRSCVFLEQLYLGVKAKIHKKTIVSLSDFYRDEYYKIDNMYTHLVAGKKLCPFWEKSLKEFVQERYPEYIPKVKKTKKLIERKD